MHRIMHRPGLVPALRIGAGLALASLPAGPGRAAQDQADSHICVDVQIGAEAYYSCLNEQLKRFVADHRAGTEPLIVSAGAPAPAVGMFNQTATHQQMGDNFGRSAFPQRPPPTVFSNPLIGAR